MAIAWPLARWLGSRLAGRSGGDATLFDDGGVLVAEALRAVGPSVGAFTSSSLLLASVSLVLAHVTFAGLLDAFARPAPLGMRARLSAAVRLLPVLLLVGVGAALVAAGVFGIVGWTGRSLVRAWASTSAAADLGVGAVILVGLAVASWVGVFHDLLASALVGRRLGFMAALEAAWGALRSSPLALWGHRALRSVGSAAVVGAAALAALQIGMRAQRDAVVAQLLLEAALVAATCFRASWLAIAVDAVAESTIVDEDVASTLQDAEDSSKYPPAATPR